MTIILFNLFSMIAILFNGCHGAQFHFLMQKNDTGEIMYVTDDNDYLKDFERHPELKSDDPEKALAIVKEFLVTRGFGYNPNEGPTRLEKGLNVLKAAKAMKEESLGQKMSDEDITNLKSGISPNTDELKLPYYKVTGEKRALSVLFSIYLLYCRPSFASKEDASN